MTPYVTCVSLPWFFCLHEKCHLRAVVKQFDICGKSVFIPLFAFLTRSISEANARGHFSTFARCKKYFTLEKIIESKQYGLQICASVRQAMLFSTAGLRVLERCKDDRWRLRQFAHHRDASPLFSIHICLPEKRPSEQTILGGWEWNVYQCMW